MARAGGVKRILHVIRSADPAGGGPIEAITRLGLEHVGQGRDIEFATLDAPDAPWLTTFPLRLHPLGPVSTKYGYTPRLLPWLKQHCSAFDVVIVSGIWQYTSFAVWRATRAAGTPYVVFPHGMLDPWFRRQYPLKHLKKWLYWPWAEYQVLRDAAAVLFTSEDERRSAGESFWLYRCNARVVSYGTAVPPEASVSRPNTFLETFPGAAGTRIVLFFGRVHEKKGCELLVRAFAAAVRQQGPTPRPWHLVLAGPVATAAYRTKLERLIGATCPAGSVSWTGMLSGDLKWDAFRAADVFALPSHQENFGVAVAEALACGLPVLISDKVNIWREIVADGAGFADRDDAEGTERLLARWMALDDDARNRMRSQCRRSFAERFAAPNAASRIAEVIEAAI